MLQIISHSYVFNSCAYYGTKAHQLGTVHSTRMNNQMVMPRSHLSMTKMTDHSADIPALCDCILCSPIAVLLYPASTAESASRKLKRPHSKPPCLQSHTALQLDQYISSILIPSFIGNKPRTTMIQTLPGPLLLRPQRALQFDQHRFPPCSLSPEVGQGQPWRAHAYPRRLQTRTALQLI